ncbi:DUF6771 family protein [Sphingobium sp. YR657]|uniref:DUF6771 family protein n=1 Tax=Sphingobium sp. YR657 TaxID=1884366 RepID=UPI003137E387
MDDHLKAIIERTVERAPQWLRNDLGGKDGNLRRSAEETLAAMIANALHEGAGEKPRA